MKKKEELEKERCLHREAQSKLRDLEMRFERLTAHTNMMLGTKEQAFETEMNVRALKQCYREAREEIDELRTLVKEQNDQLQDYRVKVFIWYFQLTHYLRCKIIVIIIQMP